MTETVNPLHPVAFGTADDNPGDAHDKGRGEEPAAASRTVEISLDPGAELLEGPDRDGTTLIVRHGEEVHRIGGDAAVRFVRSLVALADDQGRVTIPDPDAAGADRAGAEAVARMLGTLREVRLLAPHSSEGTPADASPVVRGLWLRAGRKIPLPELTARIEGARVTLLGDGAKTACLAERISAALSDCGLPVTRTGDPDQITDHGAAGLVIVLAAGGDDPMADTWNRTALHHGLCWLPVIPFDGRRLAVGPFTFPGASACWRCFRLRRAANFPAPELVGELSAARGLPLPGPAAVHPGLELMATGLVVDRALEHLALREHAALTSPGVVTTIEAGDSGLRLRDHRVLRVPRCPECSPAAGLGLPQVWFHNDDAVLHGQGRG